MIASKQSQDGTPDSAWKRSSETCMELNDRFQAVRMELRYILTLLGSGHHHLLPTKDNGILYTNISRVCISRNLGWACKVAHMGKLRNAYKILI